MNDDIKIKFRDFLAVPFWLLAHLFDWLAITIGGVWTADMFLEESKRLAKLFEDKP